MKLWDAIIVGAGPAGCACAYDLAAAGKSVLLLDKANFPRPKACAGGLTIKTVRALRYSIEPVVRQTMERIVLEKNSASSVTVRHKKPICVMTVREELDTFCLSKTIEAGAQFEKITGIQKISPAENHIEMTSGNAVFHTRFLVGADGVHSQVRRLTSDPAWFYRGFAIEANLKRSALDDDLVFDFGLANGYGWVFPKNNHVNVGLYRWKGEEHLDRARLSSYIADRFPRGGEAEQFVGQYLGFGAARHGIEPGRIFLIGDAGGFVDPLTGEGIYGAVASGQAAASAICGAPESETWRRFTQLSSTLRQNLQIAEKLAHSFYARPERGFRAMKIPLLRSAVIRSYAEGLNLTGLIKIARHLSPHS